MNPPLPSVQRPRPIRARQRRASGGRRDLLGLMLLGAAQAGLPASALAQPADRPLRLVVPFPAGGTADILPRVLADVLRAQFPAGIVVENRVGAGGNIGAESVFRAEPDGATLMAAPPGPIAINHNLYSRLSFDPTRWLPVTVMATVPNVLAVSNRLPVSSASEFIAYAKANPGKLTYASQGNGSTSHLTAALFMSLTGTQMTHVPYKGTAPALVDLMAGHVDVFFDNLGSTLPQHQAGKLRILAVADQKRAPALPNVPTCIESGVANMEAVTWFAIVAPPGTPASTVAQLNRLFVAALQEPSVRSRFGEQSADVRGGTVEQTTAFIRQETERWLRVIQSAQVKAD